MQCTSSNNGSLFSLTIYTCNSCNEPRHLYINSITLIIDTHSQGERIIFLSFSFSLSPFLTFCLSLSLFFLFTFFFALFSLFLSSLIYIIYHYAQCNPLFTSVYVARCTVILITAYPRFAIRLILKALSLFFSLLARKYNLLLGQTK